MHTYQTLEWQDRQPGIARPEDLRVIEAILTDLADSPGRRDEFKANLASYLQTEQRLIEQWHAEGSRTEEDLAGAPGEQASSLQQLEELAIAFRHFLRRHDPERRTRRMTPTMREAVLLVLCLLGFMAILYVLGQAD